jgi:hypothetical protein
METTTYTAQEGYQFHDAATMLGLSPSEVAQYAPASAGPSPVSGPMPMMAGKLAWAAAQMIAACGAIIPVPAIISVGGPRWRRGLACVRLILL